MPALKPGDPTVLKRRKWASLMTVREFRVWVKKQRENGEPCKHGHLGCSDVDGGRCLDETLANQPELEEAE